jgi:hypothetical protein
MKTIDQLADPDTEALIESISTGKPLDPEIRERIRVEGKRLTEELSRAHGVRRLSANLIREVRDEA